jgi:hypothetical protein
MVSTLTVRLESLTSTETFRHDASSAGSQGGAAMRGSYDGPVGRAPHKLARAVRRSAGFGLIALGMSLAAPGLARADEGGVSFWFPGQFGSLAAVPQAPGWSVGILNVYESVGATGNVAAAREVTIGKLNPNINVNLNVSLTARPDLVLVAPSYAFATPVLGGQLDLSMGAAVGRSAGDLAGVLTVSASGLTATRQGKQATHAMASAICIRRRRYVGIAASTIG